MFIPYTKAGIYNYRVFMSPSILVPKGAKGGGSKSCPVAVLFIYEKTANPMFSVFCVRCMW